MENNSPVPIFFDRDLSWLSFNSRLLDEANRKTVPLMERLNFLSIYSSNLDEFYRVRMPALLALEKIAGDSESLQSPLSLVKKTIYFQQERFGKILSDKILPELTANRIHLLLNSPIPEEIRKEVDEYFFEKVAGYIQLTELMDEMQLFPENNKLYQAVIVETKEGNQRYFVLNIPSDQLPRFFSVTHNNYQYILFLEDIIKINLSQIFGELKCICCYSFKITRDAELDLKDEFEGNLAKKIEHEISHRDLGLASRFLYEAGMPTTLIKTLRLQLGLQEVTMVEGGHHHNLKDLSLLPLANKEFYYEAWPKQRYRLQPEQIRLFEYLKEKEILLHPPYHSYETVLRFFNEAAIDVHVTKIYVTMYRIANDSRIAHALINASKNGKKVTVFVELKARFDEANNIKWAKRMKEAGVRILFSIPELKVHAKIALVKKKINHHSEYYGLLSTGNFNESTARFYTDHVLLTGNNALLKEVEMVFSFLKKGRKPTQADTYSFNHLLVAQFNLQNRFIELLDREIHFAQQGLPALVKIKMNNLEDQVLITKLYEASQAGVQISLLVRGICCLIPGVSGLSENIKVIRIVDRYLEHGRVFLFHNNGQPELFLGSADWMNRNIYRRIEVCFPVYNEDMKAQLIQMLDFQFNDTMQAVSLNQNQENNPIQIHSGDTLTQSQKQIMELLKEKS